MNTITNVALIHAWPNERSPSITWTMPVMRISSRAGLASLRVTSKLRWCTNGMLRASPRRRASGKPTASANVEPSPTNAALMWMKTRIEWRLIVASTLRTLRRRGDNSWLARSKRWPRGPVAGPDRSTAGTWRTSRPPARLPPRSIQRRGSDDGVTRRRFIQTTAATGAAAALLPATRARAARTAPVARRPADAHPHATSSCSAGRAWRRAVTRRS